MRGFAGLHVDFGASGFPFLFGGTFIEGPSPLTQTQNHPYFPSFSEGLSLRGASIRSSPDVSPRFPFLFGGTFIEGVMAFAKIRVLFLRISLPFRRDFH